jgi:hypothetical protein
MANPDFSLMERFQRQESALRSLTIDGGGGGGDDSGMEARITALEQANLETRDRLARIETRLDSVATKADLAELTAAFHREINSQTWKLVTFVCSFGTALVAATYFFAKHVS